MNFNSEQFRFKKYQLISVAILAMFVLGLLVATAPAEATVVPTLKEKENGDGAFRFYDSDGNPIDGGPAGQNTKVNREDSAQPWNIDEFPTGIKSGATGELRVEFDNPDGTTEIVKIDMFNEILLTELSTGDSFLNTEELLDVDGYEIVIPHKKFREGEIYRLQISEASVSYTSGGSGNVAINWRFTTEKRPKPINIIFEPSGKTFSLDDQEYIYPDYLSSVHAHGIDRSSTIIIELENGVSEANKNYLPIDSLARTATIDNNRLIIKTDSLLDYDKTYKLSILPKALKDIDGGVLENETFQFRFRTADNFDRGIMGKEVTDLNYGIFFDVPSRYIGVEVPKRYIIDVETIHHLKGLIPLDNSTQENLTNVEIIAASEVNRITIKTDRVTRHNIKRFNNRFSATFAGLEANITYLEIIAYDRHDKELERYKQRLEVDGANPMKLYDRTLPAGVNGTHTLYDLMSNNTLMQNIINSFPVSELHRIGLFYPYDL